MIRNSEDFLPVLTNLSSSENIIHNMDIQAPYLGYSGDGGVAADAWGVDGQPAGGRGGGVQMVGIVDSTVSMGNTHSAIGTVGRA